MAEFRIIWNFRHVSCFLFFPMTNFVKKITPKSLRFLTNLGLWFTCLWLVKIEVGHGRRESSFRLRQLTVEHLIILCMWGVVVHVCAIHLWLNFKFYIIALWDEPQKVYKREDFFEYIRRTKVLPIKIDVNSIRDIFRKKWSNMLIDGQIISNNL